MIMTLYAKYSTSRNPAFAIVTTQLDDGGLLIKKMPENPSALGDIADPSALADALKAKSLKLVAEATGAEVLP